MNESAVIDSFDDDDIQKIREYHSLKYIQMAPGEIIADTKKEWNNQKNAPKT